MEELLNKLIEKGWKPFELSYRGSYDFEFKDNGHTLVSCHSNEDDEYTSFDRYSWRELVSKSSGLWQFVCENGMVVRKRQGTNWLGGEPEKCFDYKDYEYRLIEASLKDESELKDFLLSNIKL